MITDNVRDKGREEFAAFVLCAKVSLKKQSGVASVRQSLASKTARVITSGGWEDDL